MQITIVILFAFLSLNLQAQNCPKYYTAMEAGNNYLYKTKPPNYDKALIEFQAAQISARECGKIIDSPTVKLKEVFKGLAKQRDDAVQAKQEAEVQRRKAIETGGAFRLIILAQQKVNTDPTIALRIAEAAMEKVPDSLILKITEEIFDQHSFYKIIGNKVSIRNSAISPDGTQVLTSGNDVTRLWRKDGSLINEFRSNKGFVKALAVSTDGTKILTLDRDRRIVRLIDERDSVVRMFRNQEGILSLAISPDGKNILAGLLNGALRLWKVEGEGDSSKEFKGNFGTLNWVGFSRDGQNLIIANNEAVLLLDTNGSQSRKLDIKVNSIARSKEGKIIFIGNKGDTVGLFSFEGDLLTEFKENNSKILSVAFSPDGSIATGSDDGIARVWSSYGVFQKEFKGHTGAITSIAFSSSGATFVTWSLDGTVRSWYTSRDLKSELKIQNKEKRVTHLVFSQDGRKILTVSEDQTIGLWNIDGTRIREFQGSGNEIVSIALSADANRLLTNHKDSSAILWNISGVKIGQFSGSSFALSSDGRKILAGTYNGTVKLWSSEGSLLKEFEQQGKPAITCVAFSPDGNTFLAGSNDQAVSLWNIGGALLWRQQDSTLFNPFGNSEINSVSFSADAKNIFIGLSHLGGFMVTIPDNGMLWNIKGTKLGVFPGSRWTFSSDGKQILCHNWSHYSLWNLNGTLVRKHYVAGLHSAIFAEDGKTIITGSGDGIISHWNPPMTLKEFLQSNKIERLTEQQLKEFGIK